MMYNIIIFGVGESCEKVYRCLFHENIEIISFADNNKEKQGKYHKNIKIISPLKIGGLEYDYIIIASNRYEEITEQLRSIQVDIGKIIPCFDFEDFNKDKYSEIISIDNLRYMVLNDELKRSKTEIDNLKLQTEALKVQSYNFIENMPFEYFDKLREEKIELPIVNDENITAKMLIENRVSISRFGNGEFDIIFGKGRRFQKENEQLAIRLKEILRSDREGHIVAISDFFGDISRFTPSAQTWVRSYLANGTRERIYEVLDMNKTYFDAYLTRPYLQMSDKKSAKEKFKRIREVWNQRDIVIIEGEETRFGVNNDLLDNAKSIERVLGPKEHAFDKYNEMLEFIKENISTDKLLLLALGASATVMAYDLAGEGYQAIDIGHLDIEYEWSLMNATDWTPVKNKYTDLVQDKNIMENPTDEKYLNQIIKCF